MALETTMNGDIRVVTMPRRFDADNAPDIEAGFRALPAGSTGKMVLDFSGTDYVASAGLRVILLVTRDVLKAGGKVALAGIRPPVLRVFAMAGFTSIFTICATRDDAIQKVR